MIRAPHLHGAQSFPWCCQLVAEHGEEPAAAESVFLTYRRFHRRNPYLRRTMVDPVRAKAKIIGMTATAFLGGVLIASGLEWTAGSHAASLLQQAPSAREVQPLAELSQAFISISESVSPAVVNISAERTRRTPRGHPSVPEEFRRFFNFPDMPEGGQVPQEAGGTGFLIASDGHIMTNNHVVEDATRIRVTLADRRQFSAQVIGRDPTTDIAVIKIEGDQFPSTRLGRSDDARVGEWVLAIGNPLGLTGTVTAGIISAIGRPLGIISQSIGSTAIEDFIQTDAAINPGNSGGPLVNLRGEVIGMNTAIASPTGYSAGYGFAVPIDLARRVADDLMRYGRSRRPILGVEVQAVSPEDAEVYQLPQVAGAVVQRFSDDSPAREAGMRQGDVIVAVDGRPIRQSNELQRVIAIRRPGETVAVEVIRYGEQLQFRVRLTEAPTPAVAAAPAPAREGVEHRLGVQVEPLTPQLATQLGYSQPGGIVISAVQPYSAAAQRGLQRGVKIVSVDRQQVRDVAQFQRMVEAKRPGEVISLLIEGSQGNRSIVNVRLPT
jgi:serine protease Do